MDRRDFFVGRFKRQISRLKHKRGHGVHSPYIYNIVREVFMNRASRSIQTVLYERLISIGIKPKHSAEIEALRHHCGYSTFEVDTLSPADIIICTTAMSEQSTIETIEYGAKNGTTIVIIAPYASIERGEMSDNIVDNHHSTTVNRRGYLIVFNNHLPKQHFTL